MYNSPYPFNQKQHVFDFKVKVDFQSGNVSLTAPKIVSPPAYFGPNTTNYQSPPNPVYQYPQRNSQRPVQNNTPPIYPTSSNQFSQRIDQFNLSPNIPRGQNPNIQMVNSSYTSFKENQFPINSSFQMIECVLCQKSFTPNQFDQHLQLHKNRNNKNYTNQKELSNNAITQNSFNANNQSYFSGEGPNNYSFQSNRSHQAYFLKQKSHHNINTNTPGPLITGLSNQNSINHQNSHEIKNQSHGSISSQNSGRMKLNMQNQSEQNTFNQNQSLHLLGRIDNPILAINAAQQTNLSQSYSSHPNGSLNYSNSSGKQLKTRFNVPNQLQANNMSNAIMNHQNSPQFNQINHSSSNSFGQQQGVSNSFGQQGSNNMIGHSFYQNNSHQSGTKNAQYLKGINPMVYNQINNSGFSNGSHQLNQNLAPSSFSHNSSSKNGINSINGINNSGYLNYDPRINTNSLNNNMMLNNFQNIESRYLNQQGVNINSNNLNNQFNPYQNNQSRQNTSNNQNSQNTLYRSQQNMNQPFVQKNSSQIHSIGFNDNDISSISRTSKADLSQCSDWSDFNQNEDLKLQGYNSADNSIMKNMQNKKQQSKSNVYLQNENRKKTEEGFFKKKKELMISSATSYYDKKFKDQYSSSDEEGQQIKTGRLSYVQRLKQKRTTDSRPLGESCQCKSSYKSKNLKESNALKQSKYSESSNLSKTKIPVNYLARQQFISTSSNSKSTHKSTNAN